MEDTKTFQNAAGIEMTQLQFLISFQFRIRPFARDFIAKDAFGRMTAYVGQRCLSSKKLL
ncbi:hypothetical protein [Arcticibacter sp. MXS-1]|uniref:hypothetical protein n=1 Tax=Arcticibacter sp. MXS-1 TaxID=3341726 RepID=UPI0035A8E0F8